MIYKNKNPSGKLWNMYFGLAELVDAFVRIFSLGYFCTNGPLAISKQSALSFIIKRKREKERAQNEHARINPTCESDSDHTRNG